MEQRNCVKVFVKRINQLLSTTTAKDVAKKTGISESSISGWKNGNKEPGIDNLSRIADYFTVTPDYLLGYNNEDKSIKRHLQEFLDYTGLDKDAVKELYKHRNNTLRRYAINYLLTDEDLLNELTNCLFTNIYEDFVKDKRYEYLPKIKLNYLSSKEMINTIIAKISQAQIKFTQYIKSNESRRKNIDIELWNIGIDRTACFMRLNPLFPFRQKHREMTYKEFEELNNAIENDYDSHPKYFTEEDDDRDLYAIICRLMNPHLTYSIEECDAAKKYLIENDEYRKKKSGSK